MVKTPGFHCRGQRFEPWWGNQDPTCHVAKEKYLLLALKSVYIVL